MAIEPEGGIEMEGCIRLSGREVEIEKLPTLPVQVLVHEHQLASQVLGLKQANSDDALIVELIGRAIVEKFELLERVRASLQGDIDRRRPKLRL